MENYIQRLLVYVVPHCGHDIRVVQLDQQCPISWYENCTWIYVLQLRIFGGD